MFITVCTPSSPADWPDMAHGGMHQRREHEHDPGVAQRGGHHIHGRLDRNAERFEHVGAAALRGE
jgi:hypothetical protein